MGDGCPTVNPTQRKLATLIYMQYICGLDSLCGLFVGCNSKHEFGRGHRSGGGNLAAVAGPGSRSETGTAEPGASSEPKPPGGYPVVKDFSIFPEDRFPCGSYHEVKEFSCLLLPLLFVISLFLHLKIRIE